MSHPTHPTHPNPKPKKTKHDDWVCTLCKNYNYSFRAQCNRCHVERRPHPTPTTKIIDLDAHMSEPETHCGNPSALNFPHLVFLAISEDQAVEDRWDDKREHWDTSQWNWVSRIVD